MIKIIYRVEFDPFATPEGVYCQERILHCNHEIVDELETITDKMVTSIFERWKGGKRTIIVQYEGGYEEEIFDIHHLYKKLIINEKEERGKEKSV